MKTSQIIVAKHEAMTEELWEFIEQAAKTNYTLRTFMHSIIKDHYPYPDKVTSKVAQFLFQLLSDATTLDETGLHPMTAYARVYWHRSFELAKEANNKNPSSYLEAARKRKKDATEIVKFLVNSDQLTPEHKEIIYISFIPSIYNYAEKEFLASNQELVRYVHDRKIQDTSSKSQQTNQWANRVTQQTVAASVFPNL